MIPFSRRLRTLRELLGLSQTELANLSGLAQNNISDYETGSEPKLSVAIRLDKAIRTEAHRQNIPLPLNLIELEQNCAA